MSDLLQAARQALSYYDASYPPSVLAPPVTGPPPVPTVTGISPASASSAGGATVTVTGTGFANPTTVNFGTTPATSVTVTGPTSLSVVVPALAAGAYDVVVTAPGGTATMAGAYTSTTVAAPTITSIAPTTGSDAGGDVITITGSGFNGGTTVDIGGQPATNVTFVTPTQVRATAPALAAGTYDVSVTTPGGTATLGGAYTSAAAGPPPPALPTITSITPTSGPSGNVSVTATGTGFTGATGFGIGSAGTYSGAVTNVASDTELTGLTGTWPVGTYDVAVTTPAGTGLLTGGYTVVPTPPVIGTLNPNTGPVAGGNSVQIAGANFTADCTVSFGGVPATNVVIGGTNSLTCDAPAGAGTGAAQVTITNSLGTSAPADYTYA